MTKEGIMGAIVLFAVIAVIGVIGGLSWAGAALTIDGTGWRKTIGICCYVLLGVFVFLILAASL
jgi:hypothetical protein